MLDAIRIRLTNRLAPASWDKVDVAQDIDALRDMAGRVQRVAAIIMPWKERAGRQELMTGGHRQRVEVHFVVGIVVRAQAHFLGADRAAQFDGLKWAVEKALAGWEPPGALEGCELVGGESSPIDRGISIFAQTWATARFLTGE